MKLTVKELRFLMDFIQDKRLSGYEESNWYLRNINNNLVDIKEMIEDYNTPKATQPPKEVKEVPY